MNRETLLGLMETISPMARDYVHSVYRDIVLLYAQTGDGGNGALVKASSEDMCIFFACFQDDNSPGILQAVSMALAEYPPSPGCSCFNVHGRNRRIIQLVQHKGFRLDMEGYILVHTGLAPDLTEPPELAVTGYRQDAVDEFARLFELAYGRPNESRLEERLEVQDAKQMVKAFWREGALIGCYVLEGDYVADLVVHPKYQNRGYGSHMLRHALRYAFQEKGPSALYLRVDKSNERAKRLYERLGFRTISHFAEHMYQGEKTLAGGR